VVRSRWSNVIRDINKFTSLKIIEAINGNQQESRRELLMCFFERAGTRNPNNTRYQFWQQHNHPIELNTNEKPCLALADVSRFSG
jgi:putative transposase